MRDCWSTLNSETGGLPFIGGQRLLIQYIRIHHSSSTFKDRGCPVPW